MLSRRAAMRILRAASVASATYVAAGGLLFAFQRKILFAGQNRPRMIEVEEAGVPAEEWTLEWGRRGSTYAWFLPALSDEPAPTAIFFHGNAELIDDWPATWYELARRGVNVLLLEYPGYGSAPGRPSQRAFVAAATAAYDRLAEDDRVDASRIFSVGRSLGGGSACALAAERELAAVVLMSTFRSVRPFATRFGMPAALIRDPFDNERRLTEYDGPVFIVHGEQDEVVEFEHGERLAAAAAGEVTFLPVRAGHNDCPHDWEAFFDQLEAFLREHDVLR